MDKEKEIEEIRQVMAEYGCGRKCTESCEKRGYCYIKRFVENLVEQGYGNLKQAEEKIKKLQAECDDKERYTVELYNRARKAEDKVKTAKKQAVKEFAEKLKEKVFCYEEIDGEDICDDIDQLIKELYGEDL